MIHDAPRRPELAGIEQWPISAAVTAFEAWNAMYQPLAQTAADVWAGTVANPAAPPAAAAPQTREEMLNWTPSQLAARNAQNFVEWVPYPQAATTGGLADRFRQWQLQQAKDMLSSPLYWGAVAVILVSGYYALKTAGSLLEEK